VPDAGHSGTAELAITPARHLPWDGVYIPNEEYVMTLRKFIPALSLTLSTACAHLPASQSKQSMQSKQSEISVEVRNDFTDGIGYSIYLVTLPADRRRLGDVAPKRSKTFSFKPNTYTLQYQLVATAPLKRTITSPVFILGDERTVGIDWDLDSNMLDLMETDEDDRTE
jgi:hypothetical protein